MRTVVIVDTSVLCNVLDIPGKNQDRADILAEFRRYVDSGANLILPLTVIHEAGNFIAQLADGRVRRAEAEKFSTQIGLALEGEAPWQATPFPEREQVSAYLAEFPDSAMRGCGLVDLSLISEWERLRRLVRNARVLIWSLDSHLRGYDTAAAR
jgi:hypothetical protein